MFLRRRPRPNLVKSLLVRHFKSQAVDRLMTASRTYPVTSRVDVQRAFESQFKALPTSSLAGVHSQFSHETLTIAHLLADEPYAAVVGPLQHEEIDVGESLPARCIKRGLWLATRNDVPFAVLLAPAERYGQHQGSHVEIAVPPGDAGLAISRAFMDELDGFVSQARSYRGKVLSLENRSDYSGRAGAVKVHRLGAVAAFGAVPGASRRRRSAAAGARRHRARRDAVQRGKPEREAAGRRRPRRFRGGELTGLTREYRPSAAPQAASIWAGRASSAVAATSRLR